MGSEEEYSAFLKKVERTIYVDNLAPYVTEPVMKAAFNQFGNVTNVHFIPKHLQPKNMAQCALVEMENPKQAKAVVKVVENYPFMILGMPRPVRAQAAKPEMFDDRPKKPGKRIMCRWLDPKEPEFEVAKKIKQIVKKHDAEAAFLLQQQLNEEEKLAKQQAETLQAHYKKLELIEDVVDEGTAKKLAGHYNVKISDA